VCEHANPAEPFALTEGLVHAHHAEQVVVRRHDRHRRACAFQSNRGTDASGQRPDIVGGDGGVASIALNSNGHPRCSPVRAVRTKSCSSAAVNPPTAVAISSERAASASSVISHATDVT